MNAFIRRWSWPAAASLIVNIVALGVTGDWFHAEAQTHPITLSVKHIQVVNIPPAAPKPQAPRATKVVKRPKLDRPAAPKRLSRLPARATRSGARRVPHPIPHVAKLTNMSPHPHPQAVARIRDPFQPELAIAPTIRPNPNAKLTTPIEAPTQPTPQTQQPQEITPDQTPTPITTPTPDQSAAPVVSQNPTPSTADGTQSVAGPTQSGGGGNGTGDSGSGSGAGGVLPFGLGGGSGGSGQHRIVYVLDISPSMTSRIGKARSELNAAMAGLSPDDEFNIIAFGGDLEPLFKSLRPANDDNLGDAHRFLASLILDPSTDLEQAIVAALNMGDVNEIVVLTDGVPTSGVTNFKQIANDIRKKNRHHVTIDTIGLVGLNPDGTDSSFEAKHLLQNLSDQSGGQAILVPLGVATPD